jgi:hypothetical protein
VLATALQLLRWSAQRDTATGALPDALILDRLRRRRIDSLAYLAAGAMAAPHQRLYTRLWATQRSVLESVTGALRRSGVPVIVFKGSEFITRCFDSQPVGMLFDVDVLVPRHDVERAKVAMHSLGLRQTVWDHERRCLVDRDVADVARLETSHYELAPFGVEVEFETDEEEASIVRAWDRHPLHFVDGKVRCVVEVDIHHQVASDIAAAPLFQRAVSSALADADTLSPADLVWFTISRFYTEVGLHSKRSLRDFAYVGAFLTRHEVSWGVVIDAAQEYGLHSSLYYYLAFLARIAGVGVPDDVFARLDPANGTRNRDWGWQLGRLLDFVEPFPLPHVCAASVQQAPA